MYFPTDKLYIETKAIKYGEKAVKAEYLELANWAQQSLNITILNAFFLLKNRNTLPSLHIIFELQKDYNQLHGDPETPYNKKYNKLIAENFLRIAEGLKIDTFKEYNADNFHMSYSVFSDVAIVEYLNNISKSNLKLIKEKYALSGLWEISIHYGSIVVFYTKEAEIEINKELGISKQIENELRDLASRYDEFGYIKEESFILGFDSKENFEEKYAGNWHSYYR